MSTLDQIFICNPTDTDFEVQYDKEFYYLKAGEETTRVIDLAYHMAKHLSSRMLIKEFYEIHKVFVKNHKNLTPHQVDQQLGTQKNMLVMQDCPERRIALYKILRSKDDVEAVLHAYPQFKTKRRKDKTVEFSVVGDISIYNEFVEKAERKTEPIEPKEEVSEETPTPKKVGRPAKTPQA